VRIFAWQQAQQQFIQIKAAHQRFTLQQQQAFAPLQAMQVTQFCASRPCSLQRLECLQHAAHR
jgi:hypothetical protein